MLITPEVKVLYEERKNKFLGSEVVAVDKVVLTKKQAEAIEEVKDKDYAINILALQKRPDHALATLEISQIAKLLYGLVEYEIEPEQPDYNSGDIVITKKSKEIVTLSNPMLNREAWFLMDDHGKAKWIYTKDFRHATPEEIYWLETMRRKELGEFKEGDVFVGHDGSFFILNEIDVEDARIWYKDGALKGIYPAESFKPFSEKSEV